MCAKSCQTGPKFNLYDFMSKKYAQNRLQYMGHMCAYGKKRLKMHVFWPELAWNGSQMRNKICMTCYFVRQMFWTTFLIISACLTRVFEAFWKKKHHDFWWFLMIFWIMHKWTLIWLTILKQSFRNDRKSNFSKTWGSGYPLIGWYVAAIWLKLHL